MTVSSELLTDVFLSHYSSHFSKNQGKYSVGVELRKNIYFPRAQRAETGAERPLAALWVDSIRILSCFAGESGGRGDYAELQMVSKLFSE